MRTPFGAAIQSAVARIAGRTTKKETNLHAQVHLRPAATAAIAAVGAAATPAMAQNSGVWAGDASLLNLDASSALHWQICGQNILAQSFGQKCDNRDHIDESRWPSGPHSGITRR